MSSTIELWLGFAGRGAILVAAAAALSALLICLLWPLLQRYAIAIPNGRSSHRTPTPQGGGIAVAAATIVVALAGAAWMSGVPGADLVALAPVLAGAVVLAAVGAFDDIRHMPVAPRFILQALVAAAVLAALPSALHIIPALPLVVERALLVIALVWFINLVNFMDGIDWMTVAEVVPVTLGLAVIGALGGLPSHGIVFAFALCGAILGFAPFNRPVARLFLGDVGSLPVGLMIGWLLVLVAGEGHVAAAIILPLYYLADTGITLARRILKRERFWQAHRTHFYQRATDHGFGVMQIVTRVFAINVALAACAVATVHQPGPRVAIIALICAVALVGLLLMTFSRAPR